MTAFDVAVLGLGPAGRALAHRLTAAGASIVAIDPHPDRRWRPTYGGWAHQLPGWLDAAVIGASSHHTALIAREAYRLPGRYVVLDNEALREQLDLPGVTVRAATAFRGFGGTEPLRAHTIVDCRGNLRGQDAHVPLQTAFGLKLPPRLGEHLLGDAEAVMMDWRPFDGADAWQRRRPSFCYLVPLPDGRLLAEETCLAGRPALGSEELERRLRIRLAGAGIDERDAADAEIERVRIPMLPAPAEYTNRFGAAGAEVNPISGYSVFASLAAADDAARILASGARLAPTRDPWRPLALEAVLALDAQGTVDLFDAFARLPARDQRTVLDPHASTRALLPALGRQWWRMPWSSRPALVAATARGLVARGVAARGPVKSEQTT